MTVRKHRLRIVLTQDVECEDLAKVIERFWCGVFFYGGFSAGSVTFSADRAFIESVEEIPPARK